MKQINTVPTKVEGVVEVIAEQRSEIVDAEGGLITLLGKRVLLHCMNYNYSGKLVGVDEDDVELEDASVVFDTGSYTDDAWKYADKVPSNVFVRTAAIEAYWESSK